MREENVRARYEKLFAPRYGVSLVAGFPFEPPTSMAFGRIQSLLKVRCPGRFVFVPLLQLHMTILRGKSVPTPLTIRTPPYSFAQSVGRIQSRVVYWSAVEVSADGAVRIRASLPHNQFYEGARGDKLAAILSRVYGVRIMLQQSFWVTIASAIPQNFVCKDKADLPEELASLLPHSTILRRLQLVYYRDLQFYDTEIIASYPLSSQGEHSDGN